LPACAAAGLMAKGIDAALRAQMRISAGLEVVFLVV
jgi:hypothetical protein